MSTRRNLCYKDIVVSLTVFMVLLNIVTGIFVHKKLYASETPAKAEKEIKNISPKQAKELIDKEDDIFVLDVRTRKEYNTAHIKDAHLIPIQELGQKIESVPKDKKVIVHCASGRRSAKAYEMLKDKGLKELYNMDGGINQWQAEGYPVEKHE
ncbi:MAG: rhodanese-like domain-containing protein [wastewater metagenome]|nr:rhodanese-like domain-containing protein [Candidatus Loosdrechtia aerotolerans]